MARVRQLAECCLADPAEGHVNALLPDHPDEPFTERDPNVVLTPGQRALALAALHDVHCPGVAKVIAVPGDLTFAAVLADEQLIPAWTRAFRWAVILDIARALGDWALPWFELQMRRFEQEYPERAGEPPTSPPAESGVSEEVSRRPEKTDPCNLALAFLIEAHRTGAKPTVTQVAKALGIKRPALYANKAFAPVRDMGNKLFGLFGEELGKGDWQGPRGSKSVDGTMEAVDPDDDSEL